ncbi:unnamed protein product [Gordionus sp. m RMFG-2023]|uniref:RNA polymerase I-specific transcription initiation factor RRN3-like n=1 Tax=Gordionus sp. m RMFG-2023 TaxID=3053472 RepID=UPI0030E011B4
MGETRFINILELALKGETKEMDVIKHIIEDESTNIDIIKFLLNQISLRIISITDISIDIIWSFLDSKNVYNPIVYDLYSTIICEILLCHPFSLKSGLKYILNLLITTSESDKMNIVHFEHYNNLISLITRIYNIFPSSSSTMTDLIRHNFPHPNKICTFHCNYLIMALRIINLINQSDKEVLMDSCINYVLNIDINCTNIYNNNENNISQNLLPVFDTFIKALDQNSESMPFLENNYDSCLIKIDEMLYLLLNHIKSHFDNHLSDNQSSLVHNIFTAFDNHILHQKECYHTHFLVFYICHFSPNYAENFIEFCWKKFTNPKLSPFVHHNSIYYMGSFIAMANFVHIKSVFASIEALSNWALYYLSQKHLKTVNTHKNSGNNISNMRTSSHVIDSDLEMHYDFYVVCQTLLYIVCARHQQIFNDADQSFIKGLSWDRILFSDLNPLKFCSTPIINRFSSITRQYKILYCNTVIEHNDRMQKINKYDLKISPSLRAMSSKITPQNILGAFYPFQKFLLKKSSIFIDPLIYNNSTPKNENGVTNSHRVCSNQQVSKNDPYPCTECMAELSEDHLAHFNSEYTLGLTPPDKFLYLSLVDQFSNSTPFSPPY